MCIYSFTFENNIDQKQGVGEYSDGKDRDISDASLSIFFNIVWTSEPLKYFTYSKSNINGTKM